MNIDRTVAKKVLEVVDAGLSKGLGVAEPGSMCVEAAVCYAFGLPHGDDPQCVSYALRSLKITLNDTGWSSNEARAKGMRKLAVLQLGTLNVLDEVEFVKRVSLFTIRKTVPSALRSAAKIHPAKEHRDALEKAAVNCENTTYAASARAADAAARAADAAAASARAASARAYAAAAYAAYAAYAYARASAASASAASAASASAASASAAYAAYADAAAADAADQELIDFAEGVSQILIEMKVPAIEWLDLL